MLSKCANPECAVSCLKEARFFRFHRNPQENQPPVNPHSVQHFWLCRACSGLYTLEYHKEYGVIIRSRFVPRKPAGPMRIIAGA